MAKVEKLHIPTEKELERARIKAEKVEEKRLITQAAKSGKRRWEISGSYRRLLPPGE